VLARSECVSQLQSHLPTDTHSAFLRAMIFRIGGATIGLILYSAFGIITGLESGYLSLAVGFIVGKAIRMGSLRSAAAYSLLGCTRANDGEFTRPSVSLQLRGMRGACD